MFVDNGLQDLCGTNFGEICYNNGLQIPAYIVNNPDLCQYEIQSGCTVAFGSFNFFCSYWSESPGFYSDYCIDNTQVISDQCYVQDNGSYVGGNPCVVENGTCQFPLNVTFGNINLDDSDCDGCKTIEILIYPSLPVYEFSNITFKYGETPFEITHVIRSQELANAGWEVDFDNGTVSVTNSTGTPISSLYSEGVYSPTGKMIYKIGFADTTPSTIITMDNELSQTRFYCPDCYFGGTDVGDFISITQERELVMNQTIHIDCDQNPYHSGDSHTISDECGVCVDSSASDGCWYSVDGIPCDGFFGGDGPSCPDGAATCDGVPNGNASWNQCSVGGEIGCCGGINVPACSEFDECGVCDGGGIGAVCTDAGLTLGDVEGNCCDIDGGVAGSCTIGTRDCENNCTCDANGENCAVTYDQCGVCGGNDLSMECNCCPPDSPENGGQCNSNGIWSPIPDGWEWPTLRDCQDTCFGSYFIDINCNTCTESEILLDCAGNCQYTPAGDLNSAYLGNQNGLDADGVDDCGVCPSDYPNNAGDQSFCVQGGVPPVNNNNDIDSSSEWYHCYSWSSNGCFDCKGELLGANWDICGYCDGGNAADEGCGCDAGTPNVTLFNDGDAENIGCTDDTELFCENINTEDYVTMYDIRHDNAGNPCTAVSIYTPDNDCFISNSVGNALWLPTGSESGSGCTCNSLGYSNLDNDGYDCNESCNGEYIHSENGCCLQSEKDCHGNCPNCYDTQFDFNGQTGTYVCAGNQGYLGPNQAGFDCAGVCGGSGSLDECGVCNGGNLSCTGCQATNACNTGARADGGGMCPGNTCLIEDNSVCDYTTCCNNGSTINNDDGSCTCTGNYCPSGAPSDSVCTSVNDECGTCAGDNSSCADCAGIPNGFHRYDFCGNCLLDSNLTNVCDNDPDFDTPCEDSSTCGGGNCIEVNPRWNEECCSTEGTAIGNTGGECGENACSGVPICDCDGTDQPGQACGDDCSLNVDDCSACGGSSYWNGGSYQGLMGCNHMCYDAVINLPLVDNCGNCQYLENTEDFNPLYYGTDGTTYNDVVCNYADPTTCPQGCMSGN